MLTIFYINNGDITISGRIYIKEWLMKGFIYLWLLLTSVFFVSKVYADSSASCALDSNPPDKKELILSSYKVYSGESVLSKTRHGSINCTIHRDSDDDQLRLRITVNKKKGRYKLEKSGLEYTIDISPDYSLLKGKHITKNTKKKFTYNSSVSEGKDGLIKIPIKIEFKYYKIGKEKAGIYQKENNFTIDIEHLFGDHELTPLYSLEELLFINTDHITIKVPSCTLTEKIINVNLPLVTMAQLSARHSTAAEKEFNIPLTCDADTRVNVTLQANKVDGHPNVIKIKYGTNMAKGVGIQILDDKHNPINLGEKIQYIKKTKEEDYVIRLIARYYRYTKDSNFKPGRVKASATFTVSYE